MPIPTNFGRPAALVTALALVACGGSQGGGGPCDYNQLQKGCVGFLNFYGGAQQVIDGVTVPAPSAANGGTAPGIATKIVSNTSVGSVSSFQATVNGAPVSVSCTVTSNAWLDVNPGVVLQQYGVLSCINW